MNETAQNAKQQMVSCPRCVARGKTWEGGDPECSFLTGVFSESGWNCATANAIRELCKREQQAHNEDTHACVLSGGEVCGFVLVSWYKRRGRTDVIASLGFDGSTRPLTLDEAEQILAANPQPSGRKER